ncbi:MULTISPECIES: hypothetical protein [Rhizobium]|uniref:hypothetical protein n=1 Tax=Rhizobium TaxID=379 RepID=UPI0018E96CAC|nr:MULTISPECIES: hypothetical protein [Rhizobium]
MIRFEKKTDPQPLPKDVEHKSPTPIQEPAREKSKKSDAKVARGHKPQVADDDRLI